MKTITVKGIGNVSSKPDTVEISIGLESVDLSYEKAMAVASEKINTLTKALLKLKFKKDEIKTVSFDVNTQYDHVRGEDGEYRSVFSGYRVSHGLRISFGFDSTYLSRVISAISKCNVEPRLSVLFTVKDTEVVKDAMLAAATENAKRKAEVICKASGITLGEIVSVNYNWGEINVYSPTTYGMADTCMNSVRECKSVAFEPENIETSDSVTFVWEIK